MIISSRTPEGQPVRCPLCGNEAKIVSSSFPTTDAPCPSCGQLLWLSSGRNRASKRETIESSELVIERWSQRRKELERDLAKSRPVVRAVTMAQEDEHQNKPRLGLNEILSARTEEHFQAVG